MQQSIKNTVGAFVVAVGFLAGVSGTLAANTNLNMGMVLEPPHLDPTGGAAAAIDEVVYANVFEGLTRIDENGAVKPALAKSWTVSADGLTYVFALQTGVKFHDGTAMDADDVVFSLNRIGAKESTNAQKALFKAIAKVKADGAGSVVMTLSQATGRMLFNLGWGDAVIVARESAATNKAKPVGTGPFKFKRWVKGDRVELVENPDYWGTKPALKTVTFKFIPDAAAAAVAMLAGDVDAFANFPAPENLKQFEADPRFAVVVGSTEGETILSTNNTRKPFDDVRVRRAIAYALDRKAIVDGAMFGYGTVIGSHFSRLHPAYVDLTGRYPFDLAKAKALLAEAGLPNGFKATIKLPPVPYARRGGEVVADQLRKIGIDLEIIPIQWSQWLSQVFKGKDYDLTIVSHTEPLDIGIYARPGYYFNYRSERFNAVFDKLTAARDKQIRSKLMGEAQRILSDDAVNGFLFQLAKLGVWNAKVSGLWRNSPVQANDLTGVSWKE
ncbi:MAG: ABC transporter substrate-binding protein [Alphaproteobacteria bacterium]